MHKKLLYTLALILFLGTAIDVYSLTVSPAKIEITGDPGQTIQGDIELFNEQEEGKTFYVSYENFESRGDSGAPYFIGAQDGLATWISSLSEVTLVSGERKQVSYTISIPASAKPGGYFSAIFFGSQPVQDNDGGEVTIGSKIGVLLLLKVSGEVEESAGLVDFGIKNGQRFFSTLPVTFQYGFTNTGGDRLVPRGEIKIKNTFQLTSATLLANDREGSVLPNSTRRFEVLWGKERSNLEDKDFFETAFSQLTNFHFGWYRATMHIAWGASSQSTQATYNFFVIPWQLLSVLAVLLAIAWCVFKLWARRFKQRILEEAMRNKSNE